MKKKRIFQTLNIAHRGFSAKYPENTIIAFKAAIDAGCDGIELDVHLTADGEVVVIHDNTLERTTNGFGLVSSCTFAELKMLDAGSWMNPNFAEERIPHLNEVLELALEKGILLNIEIKHNGDNSSTLLKKVLAMVQEKNLESKVLISSFKGDTAHKAANFTPGIVSALIYSSPLIWAVSICLKSGIKAVNPAYRILFCNFLLLRICRTRQLMVNVWTVNLQKDMKRLIKMGVDGIITNHPDLLARVLLEERAGKYNDSLKRKSWIMLNSGKNSDKNHCTNT